MYGAAALMAGPADPPGFEHGIAVWRLQLAADGHLKQDWLRRFRRTALDGGTGIVALEDGGLVVAGRTGQVHSAVPALPVRCGRIESPDDHGPGPQRPIKPGAIGHRRGRTQHGRGEQRHTDPHRPSSTARKRVRQPADARLGRAVRLWTKHPLQRCKL